MATITCPRCGNHMFEQGLGTAWCGACNMVIPWHRDQISATRRTDEGICPDCGDDIAWCPSR